MDVTEQEEDNLVLSEESDLKDLLQICCNFYVVGRSCGQIRVLFIIDWVLPLLPEFVPFLSRPVLSMTCPKCTTSNCMNRHLSLFSLSPASFNFVNTLPKLDKCSGSFLPVIAFYTDVIPGEY